MQTLRCLSDQNEYPSSNFTQVYLVEELVLNILRSHLKNHINLMHFIGQHKISMDITDQQMEHKNMKLACQLWNEGHRGRGHSQCHRNKEEMALLAGLQFVQPLYEPYA